MNINVNSNISNTNALDNVVQYMYEHRIFNTYVIGEDSDSQLSIIIKSERVKTIDLLNHLEKPVKISCDDDMIKEGDNCAICYEQYKVGEYKRGLKDCGHFFH